MKGETTKLAITTAGHAEPSWRRTQQERREGRMRSHRDAEVGPAQSGAQALTTDPGSSS